MTKTMECQVEKYYLFRHLLLYEFNRDSKAAKTARNICAIYGEDSVAGRTAQKWFTRLKQGNFKISDTPHSVRPCCVSGGIWRGLSVVNCLRGT
jgi:hypothetical protein